MKEIGIGLFWVVFIYITFKIVQWAWPIIELMIQAGLALFAYGVAAIVICVGLYIIGSVMRRL
jgi:hypothetical protein